MLKNAPFLITIGVDTAENEPRKESWVVARTGVSILRAAPGFSRRPRPRGRRPRATRARRALRPGLCSATASRRLYRLRRFALSFRRQHFNQSLAKLAPPIAREGAFFSVKLFRDLHDFHTFCRKLT